MDHGCLGPFFAKALLEGNEKEFSKLLSQKSKNNKRGDKAHKRVKLTFGIWKKVG